MQDVITAGVDGTPEATAAALWAAHEAELRRARLRLLHAWVLLGPEPGAGPTPGPLPAPDGRDERNYWPHRIVDEARDAVRDRHPDLPVEEALVADDPLSALKEAAGQSSLLVLGSRDIGVVARYTISELGLQVVAHTRTPTVLVRAPLGAAAQAPGAPVTAALSLHEPCEALLAFAFGSAARRGAPLRIVHGRHLPAHAYNRGGGVEPIAAQQAVADARQELAEALRPWREKFPEVEVDTRVELESPVRAALRDATDAALLVVGRRHKLRFPAPRIGHVVQAVVHHAPCPVALVPHE
ncbi:universal stress protein (plasmid) [Streptomyces sp. BHT-5-2]|uniref:universal stress protein n=1 Tax=unclassified Streptomyces TaxID=2593676 RepID=UPI001C8E6BD8|nr:universal stress protein [Streptomyces sp. BHT-5-2]QZL07472.1 universal stress protein [Streptomyces sp. BHT-5-2]